MAITMSKVMDKLSKLKSAEKKIQSRVERSMENLRKSGVSEKEVENHREGLEMYWSLYEQVGFPGISHDGVAGAIYMNDGMYICPDGTIGHEA